MICSQFAKRTIFCPISRIELNPLVGIKPASGTTTVRVSYRFVKCFAKLWIHSTSNCRSSACSGASCPGIVGLIGCQRVAIAVFFRIFLMVLALRPNSMTKVFCHASTPGLQHLQGRPPARHGQSRFDTRCAALPLASSGVDRSQADRRHSAGGDAGLAWRLIVPCSYRSKSDCVSERQTYKPAPRPLTPRRRQRNLVCRPPRNGSRKAPRR